MIPVKAAVIPVNEFNKEIYEFKNCNKCNKIIEINGVKFENIIQALNNE